MKRFQIKRFNDYEKNFTEAECTIIKRLNEVIDYVNWKAIKETKEEEKK